MSKNSCFFTQNVQYFQKEKSNKKLSGCTKLGIQFELEVVSNKNLSEAYLENDSVKTLLSLKFQDFCNFRCPWRLCQVHFPCPVNIFVHRQPRTNLKTWFDRYINCLLNVKISFKKVVYYGSQYCSKKLNLTTEIMQRKFFSLCELIMSEQRDLEQN